MGSLPRIAHARRKEKMVERQGAGRLRATSFLTFCVLLGLGGAGGRRPPVALTECPEPGAGGNTSMVDALRVGGRPAAPKGRRGGGHFGVPSSANQILQDLRSD